MVQSTDFYDSIMNDGKKKIKRKKLTTYGKVRNRVLGFRDSINKSEAKNFALGVTQGLDRFLGGIPGEENLITRVKKASKKRAKPGLHNPFEF